MKTLLCFAVAMTCYVAQIHGVPLGGLCSADSDCSGDTNGAVCPIPSGCKKGVCQCPHNKIFSGGKCVDYTPSTSTTQKKNIDATCTSNSDCGIGAYCGSSSKCTCPTGYVKASNNIDCTTYSNGASCPSEGICGSGGNGDCSSGTCKCNSGYTWTGAGGDIPQPGACVKNGASTNLGLQQTCSLTWMSDSSPKVCGGNLRCGQCPESVGSSTFTCQSGADLATATLVTIVMATVLSLLFGHL